MKNDKYIIKFLDSFYEDIEPIIDYIVIKFKNPDGAINLVTKIDLAITKRADFPLAFEAMESSRKRIKPYYRIYTGNYTVYYTVFKNIMEVRRILYKKRDIRSL